jgi:hypothetical protein
MSVELPWVRSVFGVDWTDLTAADLLAVATAGVRRAELVWLSRDHATSTRRDFTEWLTLVLAGLANVNGGLIVVGFHPAVIDPGAPEVLMEEPMPLSAAYGANVQRICRDAIVPPMRGVETRQVPVDAERGFVLVAVERSPMAPHARKEGAGALAYPVVGADGSSMRYLSESEVAERYRRRAVPADDLLRRATPTGEASS